MLRFLFSPVVEVLQKAPSTTEANCSKNLQDGEVTSSRATKNLKKDDKCQTANSDFLCEFTPHDMGHARGVDHNTDTISIY